MSHARIVIFCLLLAISPLLHRATFADDAAPSLRAWEFFQNLPLPPNAEQGAEGSKYYDFILPLSVFDHARVDLGDLRLYDVANRAEIPYALRVRGDSLGTEAISAREFNRVPGPDQSSELSLDLGENPPEHDDVEVQTPGVNYRRAALLEGSDDGKEWRKLVEQNLVYFVSGKQEVKDLKLRYPTSRFRYLRLRVFRDPDVDKDKKLVEIENVVVRHAVTAPGEFVTYKAELGPREPVRIDNRDPGSAWILTLGAAHVPCEKLLIDISDDEFNRDYRLEAAGVLGSDEPFNYISSGKLSRTAGDPRKPLEISFTEQRAGRLKLIVTDYRNTPLDITTIQFVAPARQIVFERKSTGAGPLQLFYGNPQAEPPHFDLERTLPAALQPAPIRLQLGERQTNPDYVPPPEALSERWPWAIYVVLGTASVVLAGVLLNLGRTAVSLHDAQANSSRAAV